MTKSIMHMITKSTNRQLLNLQRLINREIDRRELSNGI